MIINDSRVDGELLVGISTCSVSDESILEEGKDKHWAVLDSPEGLPILD